MLIRFFKTIILVMIIFINSNNMVFAVNLNNPSANVKGGWGQLIFAFVLFVFIIPAIVDYKQRKK